MDYTTVLLALCSSFLTKGFEKSGENVADILFEKAGEFIKLLERESPNIAKEIITTQEVVPDRYIELAKQIESVTQGNEDLQQAIKELVKTAKNTSPLDLAIFI